MWKLIDRHRRQDTSVRPAAAGPTQEAQVRADVASATAELLARSTRLPPSDARDAVILAFLERGRRTRYKSRVRKQFIEQLSKDSYLRYYSYSIERTVRDAGQAADWRWHYAAGRFPYDRPPVERAVECWAVMALATSTVRGIMNLDIWADGDLDALGLRIDLVGQLAGIAQQMLDTSDLATELGNPPSGETADAQHTRRVISHRLTALDAVRDSVLGRLVALRTYRDRLQVAENHTVLVARADRAHQLDGRIAALVQRTGHDAIGSTNLDVLSQGVHDTTAARRQALAEIRGEYFETFLAAPR